MKKQGLVIKQQGMTLIEIMVALMLGAFLLAGVMQIFLSSKQTYRMQDNMSRMQENGRFAMEFITRDIRMADYRTCFSDPSVATAISGTTGAPQDTIAVSWKTNACGGAVTTVTNSYKIENNALKRDKGDGTGFQELIEGVENMQILYGVDTDADGTPNYYVDADAGDGAGGNVVNMAQVVSVRVSLLVRSLDDNLASQPLTYTYNGVTTTATDRRLRRVFSSTIVLRNRIN